MKPIPCLKGYTYTIIQRMFLFFGVPVLVVVPEKKKGRQGVSKGFFMEVTIFLALVKIILNVKRGTGTRLFVRFPC